MPNVMAAQPNNIGGALCESSVIPFLVPRRKVWLTPLLECRAVTLTIAYRRTQDLDAKWILHVAKFRQGQEPPKVYIHSEPEKTWQFTFEYNFG